LDTEEWSVIESKTEYETSWYDGGYDRVLQPDGTQKKYYWAELSDAVVVVARTGDKLVFINQYRPTVREHCLELPAGIVESDESYTEAGRRELLEETSYRAGNVELIEDYACATGVLRHRRAMVYADELTEEQHDHDGNEFISVEPVPIRNALDVAREEPANDATIEGILLAKNDGYL
jgi:ADP-ribose pyrophosphatase